MPATSLSLLDPPQVASPTDEVLEATPHVGSAAYDHPATVAARTLFESYERPVFRYCCTRLRSRDEAEDATQTTFLRAFTALQRGVVPEFAAAWLFKIAHNVCLSQRLRAARRARVETPRDFQTADEPAAPQTRADELFDLDDALAQMPERLRTPLLLREWQGLSYNEIADALEVSHSAVETLLFRARRHLAGVLDGAAAS